MGNMDKYCADLVTTNDIRINLGYFDTNVDAEYAIKLFYDFV
jgi:hypothetical protein